MIVVWNTGDKERGSEMKSVNGNHIKSLLQNF